MTTKALFVAWSISACTAIITPGCSSPEQRRIAVQAAIGEAKNHGWEDPRVEHVWRARGHWFVTLSAVPATPGGTAEVEISAKGEVIDYRGGL